MKFEQERQQAFSGKGNIAQQVSAPLLRTSNLSGHDQLLAELNGPVVVDADLRDDLALIATSFDFR